MRYVLEGVRVPYRYEEKALRLAVADRLRCKASDFRYSLIGDDIGYDPIRKEPYRLLDLEIETSVFIRDTSIAFYESAFKFRDIPACKYKDSPVVLGGTWSGIFAAYALAVAGANPILVCPFDHLGDKQNDLGGYYRNHRKDSASFAFLSVLKECGENPGLSKNGFLSAESKSRVVEYLKSQIELRGGKVMLSAKPRKVKTFFGHIKGVEVLQGEKEILLKTKHILFAEPNLEKSLLGIEGGKAKLGVILEYRNADSDMLFYRSRPKDGVRMLERGTIKNKNQARTDFILPLPSCKPINVSLSSSHPELSVAFNKIQNRNNGVAILEISHPSLSLETGMSALHACSKAGLKDSCPVEMLGDFLRRKEPYRLGGIKPSLGKGVYLADLHSMLPSFVADALQESLLKITATYPFLRPETLVEGFLLEKTPGHIHDAKDGSTEYQGIYGCLNSECGTFDLGSQAEKGINVAVACLLGR